jgi:hypothetical protein
MSQPLINIHQYRRQHRWSRAGAFGLVGLLSLFMWWGCDTNLDVFEADAGQFAVHGILNPDQSEQAIRVRDLQAPFTASATEKIDAEITLTHLESGVTRVLSSRILADDGVFLHNYIVSDSVLYDNTYLLRAERPGEVRQEWTTRVPVRSETQVQSPEFNCRENVRIDWNPLNGGTIVLRVGLSPSRTGAWGPPVVLASSPADPTAGVHYELIPLNQIALLTRSTFPVSNCNGLSTGNLYISYVHYAPGFYELLQESATDLRLSTQLFGSVYFDTLAIRVR